ncbi:MAG: gluconeogenesis factor YvcK family protein [Bacillota bacterium]
MQRLRWLYPGLKVKRWLLLSFLGMIMALSGLVLALNSPKIYELGFNLRLLIWQAIGLLPSPLAGALAIVAGLFFALLGFHRLVMSVIRAVLPREDQNVMELLYSRRLLERGPQVVAIGGGTGLSVLLRGLKRYTSNITAIVSVFDDGGSSGRLRGELGILPPGDVRNCLVALAQTETLMEDALNYRFHQGSALAGHNLGNLLLAGLTDITGGFDRAVQELSRLLALRGRVLPATLGNGVLVAEMDDGSVVEGETNIRKTGRSIRRIRLRPDNCRPLPECLAAIQKADLVVLGPGSLYTSVLPNLVMPEMAEALRQTKAPVYYICNIMTEPGETSLYSVADHLRAIQRHAGPVVDGVVVNSKAVSQSLLKKYRQGGSSQVVLDRSEVYRLKVGLFRANLLSEEEKVIRHHPDRLARFLLSQLAGPGDNYRLFELLGFYFTKLWRRTSVLSGWRR